MKKKQITIDPYGTIELITYGVNSDTLTTDVITFTTETLQNFAFETLDDEENREFIVEYLERFYHILRDSDYIEQFDVILDKRNNNIKNLRSGMFVLETKFKQKNCLNFTRIILTRAGKFPYDKK